MDREIKAGVLTISDKGSRDLREDESGKIVVGMLEEAGFLVPKKEIVPDDQRQIADTLKRWSEKERLSLIITSGGTGLSIIMSANDDLFVRIS